MSEIEVASRELRNNTAGVLAQVAAGEDIVITVNGRPVARLVPYQRSPRRWIGRDELVRRLATAQADPGMAADLRALGDESSDELGPL